MAITNRPIVSVVVCSYNRATLLIRCLRSLEVQTADKRLYEVIVVNNNSTDQTQEVAENFSHANANFRVVIEQRQGLSCARNRGCREAKGRFVAYIDDDATARPDWCEKILSFITRQPAVAAFGGPYVSGYLSEKPAWYKDEYGSWSLPGRERPMEEGEFVRGTNMIFRTDVLSAAGGFDETLGMTGTAAAYGEEVNLHVRLRISGVEVYYCPEIVVEHLVMPGKMNVRWMLRSAYKAGSVAPEMFQRSWPFFRGCGYLFAHFVLMPIRLLSLRERYVENRILSAVTGMAWHLGTITTILKKQVGLKAAADTARVEGVDRV